MKSSPADLEVVKMEEESLNLVLGIAAFFVNYMEVRRRLPSVVGSNVAFSLPCRKVTRCLVRCAINLPS